MLFIFDILRPWLAYNGDIYELWEFLIGPSLHSHCGA